MRRQIALVLALGGLVVVAGCVSPLELGESNADPPKDKLGWENGYWYDESLDVTRENGYNESEQTAVVARAMARVEKIRQLEFNQSVPVDVITRDQYRQNRSSGNASSTHNLWNNQVWEGLFLVGEQSDVSDTFDSTLGASVQGYYSPGKDRIVIVSDAETPTIDRPTLSHELVHALQDQHFSLGGRQPTQDRQLAVDGVIEGDANFVQRRYDQRCADDWTCLPKPDQEGGGSRPDDFNRGLFLTIFQPYASGPKFVESFQTDGGWDAVNDLYSDFPVSTEQTIHPELYPSETPVNVTVRDRSNGQWRRFDHDPVADTVGEASIYAMLVANGVISPSGGTVYEYSADASAGWGGDALVPYRNDGDYGYVWKTVWDTRADAEEFFRAYERMLVAHDAESPRPHVYVVPESDPYGDAFRVVRSGKTVRIVNAPSVSALDDVHDNG